MKKKQRLTTNIYIVDHNSTYTNSLKKAIEKPSKYNIETFVTGEKFIAHLASLTFKKNDIHIVFLGYHFIDERDNTLMNGIEILEATKVINPNVEVVMLYAPDEATYGAYARNSGAYDFVPKNDTIFLRINNIVMRVISQKNLDQKKSSFIHSVKLFVAFFFTLIIIMLIYTFFF
jgi:DNA-binding NtrC family response regulator